MQNPLISIIVPCYNQAQFLDECLQSVLDQIFQNWECIIVNDGSPDNTEEVAKKWAAKDSRFIYFKKVNGGLASARNFGIEKSKAEWILPLDSDDKIGSKYLQIASEHFHKEPAIIYCEGEYFGQKTGRIPADNFDDRLMLRKNLIFCTGFFQKRDWQKAGGYDPEMKYGLEDWEFWINMLKRTKRKPLKLDYTGFFYRIKNVSMISSMKDGRDMLMINYILQKHRDLYEQKFGSYFGLINRSENLQLKLEKLYQSKSYKLYTKLTNMFRKPN